MKRPTPKLPDVQAPAFLVDLYHDLRDRRLLLPIALVVAAIVATPILLGQSSEPKLPVAAEGAIAVLKEQSGQGSSALTVVEATPGLRDYRKRLRGRTPTDPFEQRYTAPVLKGAKLNEAKPSETRGGGEGEPDGESASSGSGGGETGGSQGAGTEGAPGTGGDGDGADDDKKHPVLYTFAIDVQIVHTTGSRAEGNRKTSEPEVRKSVLPTTVLPGAKKQVVTYMGLSPKTRKPLFLVSTEVTGVFGEGRCVTGTDGCQLIELEPGFPETFEYGESGERYKLNVTDVRVVTKGRV